MSAPLVSVYFVSPMACRVAPIQGSDTAMTIPSAEAAHLSKLIALAGKTS